MNVTVELVGEGTRTVDQAAERYVDLLAPLDVSRHEVSIIVDGRPVPADEPIGEDVDHVRVVRLIKGG